jgi:hypothetical protein
MDSKANRYAANGFQSKSCLQRGKIKGGRYAPPLYTARAARTP